MRHYCVTTMLALAAPFAACVSKGSDSVGSVEFATVNPPEARAVSMPYKGGKLAIDGERLRMSVAEISIGRDSEDRPTVNVGFTDSDQKRFGDWTEANLNNYVAVIVDGEIVQVALIVGRLPGEIQISGDPEGLSPSWAEDIVARIRERH